LLSNNINLLALGDDGSIYIGSNLGLNRFFPETKRIFSYTERNGFTGIESKPNAVYKSPAGDLWFGTANGAVHMRASETSTRNLEPLTHLMSMRVNYEIREMVPGLKLSYNERSVLFDYYSICLTNPDVVKYKVKLDGADEDWRPVTDQTRAIYSALPPGKYTFNVIARNSQGIWNSKPVSFHFVIMPPFYLTWWFILLVVGVGLVIIVTYIKIREQKLIKENIILEERVQERTAEVVQKSMEIEEKNRDITASIRYAERIQRAMLPKEDTFKETFVLFMPKDIVSGDFYWMYDNGDWQFIAVVDCTGHGVPGAFMSIIGHNSLNKIVREYGLTRPSAIVDQLNVEVMKALMQRHEKKINDGMDLALIAFNKKNFTLEFAGAFNPLFVVRKGEIFVYKGDRYPIGMTTTDEKKSFTNQNVDIRPGDMLYMCTDGYADQFGSAEVKKYKSYNVKKLLTSIWDLPVNEQKERLEKEILGWKGDLEQVDDILFIGTKIPLN
jgi:serine phosphatase RsbU (regulator of sigma subunit)